MTLESVGENRRRVLIRSFPPTTNGNYGGILQTWALQQVLDGLGYDAFVDGTKASMPTERTLLGRCKSDLKRLLPTTLVPKTTERERLKFATSRPLFEFTSSHIRTVAMHDRYGVPISRKHDEFHAFVVGSDQVWRPRTMNVVANLFAELPQDGRPRLSYAASFGTDSLELRGEQVDLARSAARALTGISVREQSGIDIVRRSWGREATQHVDPTLLLEKEAYAAVGEYSTIESADGPLIDYVLDNGREARAVVERVEGFLRESAVAIMPPQPRTWKAFQSEPARYEKITIPEWLSRIARAGYVVTDSFHGTVFAIINRRPFVAIRNNSRGAARFESLLALVGLSDRLVSSAGEVTPEMLSRDIDWQSVEAILAEERRRSAAYLGAMLSQAA